VLLRVAPIFQSIAFKCSFLLEAGTKTPGYTYFLESIFCIKYIATVGTRASKSSQSGMAAEILKDSRTLYKRERYKTRLKGLTIIK
jgi:hypothetical protein